MDFRIIREDGSEVYRVWQGCPKIKIIVDEIVSLWKEKTVNVTDLARKQTLYFWT